MTHRTHAGRGGRAPSVAPAGLGRTGTAPPALELARGLLRLAQDISGVDDTPIAGHSEAAWLAVLHGDWFERLIEGRSQFPYVADLTRRGNLAAHVTVLERTLTLARKSPEEASRVAPGMQRIQQALLALPRGCQSQIDALQDLARDILRHDRVCRIVRPVKLDVSPGFTFNLRPQGSQMIKTASGRLGIPSKVIQHRSRSQQAGVSAGTGDDAGHLIANRFGAPGDARNLALQNWIQNRRSAERGQAQHGTWFTQEEHWTELLESGVGIQLTVSVTYRRGEARPYRRDVQWMELYPTGRTVSHGPSDTVTYGNFDSARRRSKGTDHSG